MFELTDKPISPALFAARMENPEAGAFVAFEGWVRNHNEGHRVATLEYEAFGPLAEKEGKRIVIEAMEKFSIRTAFCVHRVGRLAIGDMAVWVGVSADHRAAAFDACRFIIDEAKARVPIWKKEHYTDRPAEWINSATRGDYANLAPPSVQS